jgi:hypothetical protein
LVNSHVKEVTVEPTGYSSDVTFYATRYRQGGRTVYSLDLSLVQIAALLPRPGVGVATEGNRMIREPHAKAFGEYIRNNQDWVSPALVLRAPDIFTFEQEKEVGGTQFGVISFPRLAQTELRILDGQHRILGIHMAIESIAAEMEKARSSVATARRTEQDPAVINVLTKAVEGLEEQRRRFDRERTTIQIFIEDDPQAYRQMFFDIADNALGITSSVRARFDSRKVVNRSIEGVMKHALLDGRVDMEQDRIGGKNPNLVGAKQVAEIVRTLAVGIDGRVGKRLEDELREDALTEKANDFLDSLVEAFPDVASVADGNLPPTDLRAKSLLGSTVMLRVLAGVYAELVDRQGLDEADATDFFARLARHMAAPVRVGSIWLEHVPDEIFSEGASAPRSRRQDLKSLRDTLVQWAKDKPTWL